MPVLELKFKNAENEPGEVFTLKEGDSMTIGRLEDNDIVIENLAVSGHHAKIDSVGGKYLLIDLNSKNGTFVNEQPITAPYQLRHGDIIIVGKHYLVFTFATGEMPEEQGGGVQETMIMDTQKYREMKAKQQQTATAPQPAQDTGALLSFLAGGEGEVELTKKLIKIGKNASSDIVISGLTIGQTAATISKRPDGYHLSYVAGMSKPKVNGQTVKGSVLLKPFDTIEIGSVKMQFVQK